MAKSGYQIITIDGDELELVSGERKLILKSELKGDLLTLYNMIIDDSKPSKPIVLHFKQDETYTESVPVRQGTNLDIYVQEGPIISISALTEDGNDYLSITYFVY